MTPDTLADLVDSDAALRVVVSDPAAPEYGGHALVWAGRLADPAKVAAFAAQYAGALATVWWADELVEAFVAVSRQSATTVAAQLDLLTRIKATLGEALILSEDARVLLFDAAPQRTREEIQSLWGAWSPKAKAGYRARRAWALERVPDPKTEALRVARYAAWRTELQVERERGQAA